MLVINQPDAGSNIAVPMLDTKLTVHRTVKAKCLNGPQGDSGSSACAETKVAFSAKGTVKACTRSGAVEVEPASHSFQTLRPRIHKACMNPVSIPKFRCACADGGQPRIWRYNKWRTLRGPDSACK
jgi:hypothetical protein